MRPIRLPLLLIGVIPALATTASAPATIDPQSYIPDIATFLQIGGAHPAGYSWDGSDVYFTSHMSGTYQVYRLTEKGWPYQLSTFEDGIDFFALSHRGDRAIVGASVGGSEQSQLYLMETRTGRTAPLTHFTNVQISSVLWAPDDRAIYYRSNEANGRDFFIYRMDIAAGVQTEVFDQVSGFNVVADLSADGRFMIVANLSSNANDDLYLLDLQAGSHVKITHDEQDVLYDSVTLMPDNRTLWLTCNDNREGISRVARMHVDSPEVEYCDDGWLDERWEVAELGFSRDFRYMYAIVNEDGYLRPHLREVAGGLRVPGPPLEGIIDTAYFDQAGNVVFGFTGPTHAPDVWRWEPSSGSLEQLTYAIYAGIDRTIFREPSLIRFESFDGLEIPAFLYLPPGYARGEAIPFIIHAHGGPESQFQPYFLRNVQYLLLNGYGVLAPNPRGSSGYGRTYMGLDDYTRRKDSLKDYKAAADWLIEHDFTRPGMLGIRGGSYGGYVVLGMITEYPGLFAAGVDVVGIANFESFLENTSAYRRALREAEYGPLADRAFLRSISPIHKAERIRTPLLVVHGVNDPRVPIGEARQIIRAVAGNGGTVDSLIFENEGHGTGRRENTIREYRKQVAFFDAHLKG